MARFFLSIFLAYLCHFSDLLAEKQWLLEGGALHPARFYMSYGIAPNSAKGWEIGLIPTGRVGWNSNISRSWGYGGTIVPFYFERRNTFTQNQWIGGTFFFQGEPVKMYYNFSSLRSFVYFRFVGDDVRYFRMGVSAVASYAELELLGIGRGGQVSLATLFPAIYWDLVLGFGGTGNAIVFTGEALPRSTNQGFYDMFLGWRWEFPQNSMDLGIRAIWGGYSPNRIFNVNQESFFLGPVVRFRF